MNREQKCGSVLTAVGVLTLPFFVGIALLAMGILLLVKGDRINAERWIRVLFWMVLVVLALAVALFLIFPIEGQGSETSIARSILCVSPVFLAILFSLAMAALTVARFPALSRKHRIMGLGFGILFASCFCIALVVGFPWQAAGTAGLLAVVWVCAAWRKRTRARRAEALRNPPLEVVEPASDTPPLESPAPVAQPQKLAKPPRVRKPVCGIIAWLLPLMAVPIGILLGWLASRENYEGFEAWAILGWAVLPLLLALCIAPILAIASLLRRERHPWLAVVMLVFYGVLSFLYGISLVCEKVGETAAFATFIAGIGVPAAWFIWRQKRKDTTSGGPVGRAG